MPALASALLATIGVSLLALVGLFLTGKLWNVRLELRLISFAAGVLLATTFLDLLPEALEQSGGNPDILIASLVAMVVFYYLERLVHGTHTHTGKEGHTGHHGASRYFILIGDGIHNFIDGVAIAAGFLVSPEVGWVTTAAVAAHELPHEVGDYAILIRGGYSRGRAFFYNFLSALTAVLGAAVTFAFQDVVTDHLDILIAAVAGMFIYIATVNLIPELHHQRIKARFVYGLPFLVGVLLIPLILALVPHSHAHEAGVEDAHHEESAEEHEAEDPHVH